MKRSFFIVITILTVVLAVSCKKETGQITDVPSGLTPKPTATPFITPAPGIRKERAVSFSVEDTFLSKTEYLTLTAEGSTAIYYTTDGSTPSESSNKYTQPIMLKAAYKDAAIPVSAIAQYSDGTWSEVVVRSYFPGVDIAERYDCLVFQLTTDPANLFDYETGIFTAGKIFDDYMKAHPKTIVDGSTPANYNQLRGMAGERPVNVEVFNSDGSLVLEQSAGLRCYGGWSREDKMKPMKLLARKEYSEKDNKFRYPFFTTSYDENGDLVDSFKRLVLRASANDQGFAFIREELFQTLAKQAGYIGKSVRPCAVYVNGEYYGAYWLTEVYHDSFFEAHYGKTDGHFEVLEGGELYKEVDDNGENQQYVDEYQRVYDTFAYSDLTDDYTFSNLNDCIDVQNYLEYYAYQIFVGNEDWPTGNYKVFRYVAGENGSYGTDIFDGRWRFLLHDMDYSSGIYGSSETVRGYAYYLGPLGGVKKGLCPLFGQLMRREDCKKIFITKMLDLMNGVFADDYFCNQVDALNAIRLNEQKHSYKSGKLDSWIRPEHLNGYLDALKSWIRDRRIYLLGSTLFYFQLPGEQYTLNVKVPENAEVSINSWTVSQDFTGRYYQSIDTTFTAEDIYGRKPTGWLVNGTEISGTSLVLNLDNTTGLTEIEVKPIF